MSVSVGLLHATYPIAATPDALERDLLELEKANFLRPTDIPGTWLMTQACLQTFRQLPAELVEV
jgi:hypothetical protein